VRRALIFALLLTACRAHKLDTAEQVLEELGEPCERREGSGFEVWSYCLAACMPPAEHAWCQTDCFPGCKEWEIKVSGPLVVGSEEPPPP
jgi:hypothetical protein